MAKAKSVTGFSPVTSVSTVAPCGRGRFDLFAGVETDASTTFVQDPPLRVFPVLAPLPPPLSTPANKSKRSGDFVTVYYSRGLLGGVRLQPPGRLPAPVPTSLDLQQMISTVQWDLDEQKAPRSRKGRRRLPIVTPALRRAVNRQAPVLRCAPVLRMTARRSGATKGSRRRREPFRKQPNQQKGQNHGYRNRSRNHKGQPPDRRPPDRDPQLSRRGDPAQTAHTGDCKDAAK